ncbi:MAG: hypothetical protein ACI9S8_001403 [Chlamydiales bacterium]|jgi:hypothetical protein
MAEQAKDDFSPKGFNCNSLGHRPRSKEVKRLQPEGLPALIPNVCFIKVDFIFF